MRRFKIIGINFKSAQLNTIEHFVLDASQRYQQLAGIKEALRWEEVVYLATCNRVEFVFYQRGAAEPQNDIEKLIRLLLPDLTDGQVFALQKHFYFYSGAEAIHHVFKVVSSLDSMVVGENQIVGQVKRAYQEAREMGFANGQMSLLFDCALRTAKHVFSETEIGAKPTSVAYLANQFVRNFAVHQPRVIFVGAGETIQLMARYITKLPLGRVTFVNRTLARAEALADQYGGVARSLDEFYADTLDYDLLVVCTSSKQYVITLEQYERIFRRASEGRKLIIDLALPTNVDEAISRRHPNVEVHSMTDIQAMSQRNNEERQAEAMKCRELIDRQVTEFERLWKEKQVEQSLKEIPRQIKDIHMHALDQLLIKKLSHLSDSDKETIREYTNFLSNKTAQVPMRMAKEIILAQS